MEKIKNSETQPKVTLNIKKRYFVVLAAMFVTLITAVSTVAFSAYAALPEDYVYLNVSGIYHCNVGRSSQDWNPPPIVQVRVLTHSFTYDPVDSVDEATHHVYPSVTLNIQKIQGYSNDTLVAEYSTIGKYFDTAALEQVPLSGIDLLEALSGTSDSVRLEHVNSSGTYYATEEAFRESFGGTEESPNEIKFVITGTGGEEITVSSLNTNTVFNALLAFNGISADDPDYALTYYKDYTGRRVLATYDVTPSTKMYETSFCIEDLEIPVQKITNDDGTVSYLQPTFQVVYEGGGESSIVENRQKRQLKYYGDETLMCFGGVEVTTGTADGTYRAIDLSYIEGSTGFIEGYGIRTLIPVRIDLKYDLGDGVTDNNVPPLEEDSRAESIYTTSLSNCSFMTDDGANISKEGQFLDKWVIEGTDGTICEANPGEKLYVTAPGEVNASYKRIIPGSKFEKIDPATGEIVYSFTAKPTWRTTTKLRYHLNLSPDHVYSVTDQNYTEYTYPNDPTNMNYIIFDDENYYALNSSATVTDTTYIIIYPSDYAFAGWSLDEPLPLVRKTDTGYEDAYGNIYPESSVLKAGDSVLMDKDHMLYAVWRIADASQDNFIKVQATIKNGKFITEDTYTGPVHSGCLKSIAGYYICGQASSSWVNETGTSCAFVKKDKSINFLSTPNKNYRAYKIKYQIGDKFRSIGYEENQLPQNHYGYIGRCDHFWDSPLANASADETYYYEIEYLDVSSCYINFFKNDPGNEGISTTENYRVCSLDYSTHYLSDYYTKRDDGSIKLNGVGTYSSSWNTEMAVSIETWIPAPDAEFAVDGYYFVGWAPCTYVWPDYACDETDLRESVRFISKDEGEAYSSQNFAAVWAEIPDVIYYSDTDKATAIDTQSVMPDNEVTVGLPQGISTPTKAGYIFNGWKCVTSGVTVTSGKFTMPANDVEFVPEWEKSYTIIYEAGKDDVSNMPYADSDSKDVFTSAGFTGGSRTLSGTPTHAAYSFAGWSLDGTTAITAVESDKFTDANSNTVTVTALWTEKIYKLVYNANSPTGSVSDVSGVPAGAEFSYAQLLPGYTLSGSPTCEDHIFLGWSKTADGATITNVGLTDWPSDSDILNVYATWESTLVGADVTYLSGFTKSYVNDTDGEHVDAVSDISADYTVLSNSWFTREGYTFDSWTVTNSAGSVSALDTLANLLSISDIGDTLNPGDTTTLDGDLYLSAEWQLREYNVKYDPNTTDEVKSMPTDETGLTVQKGFTLNSAKDAYVHTLSTKKPTRTGYTFIGWGLTAGSTASVKSVNTTQFTSDTLTVYAIWDTVTYKVTYNKNNSTEGTAPTDTNEYAVNDSVTVLDKGDLKCGDYTFKEWNTQKNGKGTGYQPGDTFSMPANNVTLYAVWVNDKGDVISPGTGENLGMIIAAFTAMIISAGIIAVVMILRRKRRFA